MVDLFNIARDFNSVDNKLFGQKIFKTKKAEVG
jgi:hypothetical protein